MDFRTVMSYLKGGENKGKVFYTAPEVQQQRDTVDSLKRSGVDQAVIIAQEAHLKDMEGKIQQPRNEDEFNSSLDFLKQHDPAFANGIDTPQSPFVPMAPPVPPMGGMGGNSPVGGGIPSIKAPSPVDTPMSDLNNTDQQKREALDKQQKKEKLLQLFPQALAGFGDVVTAGGAPYGTKQTNSLEKVTESAAKDRKTEQENLEKSFMTDPKSGASKIAQTAAARLLGKQPAEMAGLSLQQIEKAFPLWKEALNNEQAKELKQMQLEAIRANKELMMGNKNEQFQEKQIQQIRQNLTGSKAFQNMQQIDYNGKIISDSLKDPSAYGDLGAMFAFMKALDPTSVVREGEQERFQSTASLPISMANTLNKWATGKTLQPAQRQEVARFADKMRGHAVDQYKQYNKPSIEQAQRLGYNLGEIDPMFEDRPVASSSTSATSGQPVIRKDPKTGKRYEVDPVSKRVLREVQ